MKKIPFTQEGLEKIKMKYLIKVERENVVNAEVISPLEKIPKKVQFGVKVKLLNLDTNEIFSYRIVGPYEVDPSIGSISGNFPIAKALIGKEVGEEIQVETPIEIKKF